MMFVSFVNYIVVLMESPLVMEIPPRVCYIFSFGRLSLNLNYLSRCLHLICVPLVLSSSGKHLAKPSLNSIHFITWTTFMGPDSEPVDIWNRRLLYRLFIINTMWSEHMYTIKHNPHVL